MRKRMIGVTLGAAMIVGALGTTPALARSNPTVTVICSGGQVVVSDAHSRPLLRPLRTVAPHSSSPLESP